MIFPDPIPIPKDLNMHYGIPAEHYWKPEYFSWSKDYFSYQIKKAKSFLNLSSGLKALDIGSGIGKAMKSLEYSGFDAFGIEPSKPFYDKAIQVMGIKEERLKNISVEDANFNNEMFDFISFGAVFEHLYDPFSALQKTLSWLKPNGIIHIEVPSSNWFIAKIFNLYYKLKRTNYVTNLSPMHSPFHIYEFDLKTFKQSSSNLGYEIIDYNYEVCTIYHIPKILHPFLKSYMRATNTGMQLTVFLRKI